MVFNLTGAPWKDSYKNNSRCHVMPQKQEFLAFVEKQTVKSLVKNNPKSPDLLPKPIRRQFSNKFSYWKYQSTNGRIRKAKSMFEIQRGLDQDG